MSTFEVLCATMHQKDFSKLKEMNIHTNVFFANQGNSTGYDELRFDDNKVARMVTTETRGVGKNRNLALIYASADICLLADDDMIYDNNVEQIVVDEFQKLKKADAIIFNVISDNKDRPQVINHKQKRMSNLSRNPYGTYRIAFRLSKLRSSNVWFTTMFGGGAPYPSGEDSMFIQDMMKRGMNIYISNKVIGHVKHDTSTWFSERDESFFVSKGSFLQASRKGLYKFLYLFYFSFRTRNTSSVAFIRKLKCMLKGMRDYENFISSRQTVSS